MKYLILVLCIVGFENRINGNVIERVDDLFPVSIIHINDFHARFEETSEGSNPCHPEDGDKCVGGYARAVTVIKELLELRRPTNPIYLNAGDNFQGTLWYNIGRWEVTSYFLNMLKADAMTIGNHEFDHGVEGCVPFMEAIESPIVVANINDTLEPTMQGKYAKSMVIERYGRKIGVIGVILSTTNLLARTGDLQFLDESTSIREEAAKLTEEGIDIIIVLSHCGLDVDYKIAQNAGPNIDVIVGGHSHTFMFTGDNPPGPDRPVDNYPAVVVQNEGGQTVLIVQAYAFAKYIGDITVYFDDEGHVAHWEGFPIYLDTNIVPDRDIIERMQPWKEIIDVEGLREIGYSAVDLEKSGCNYRECNLGNLMTDSFVHAFIDEAEEGEWTYASIAITNVGGIRTQLQRGTLNFADLVSALPFENTLDAMELRGDHLIEMLEYAVERSYDEDRFNGANMLQMSGLKVTYNTTNPIGYRVVAVDVLCNKCEIPRYEPINPLKLYRIVMPSFLTTGGDGFAMIPKYKLNHRVGPVDIDAFASYVENISPIVLGSIQRITMYT